MSSFRLVPVEEAVIDHRHYTLPRDISAMQVLSAEVAHTSLGPVSKLPRGAVVEACGPGFDERTLKVAFQGQYYFIFLDDLEALKKSVASVR